MAKRTALFFELNMETQAFIDRNSWRIVETLGVGSFKVCHDTDRAHYTGGFQNNRQHGSATLLTAAVEQTRRALFPHQPNPVFRICRLAERTLG